MSGGAIYKSLQDSNAGHAVTDPAWWIQYGGGVVPEPELEQVINYTMLYNQGDECGEETGGWGEGNTFPEYTRGVVTKACNRIICESSGLNKVAAVNTGLISLEGYANVRTIWSGAGSRPELIPNLQINNSTNWLDKLAGACGIQNTLKSMEVLPIPANTGQKYIFVFSNTGGRSSDNGVATVFACWLDKPDNYTAVLRTANITKTYPNSADLVADTTAMTAILSKPDAVKVLVKTCTGDLMFAILQSPEWITEIKANDVAYRIIMANPHWAKFIAVIPTAEPLLNYTMLYDQGDECESVTGGWVVRRYSTNYTAPTLSKRAAAMTLHGTYNQSGYCYTSTGLDLTPYSKLCAVINATITTAVASYNNAGSLRVVTAPSDSPVFVSPNIVFNRSDIRTIYTTDISEITGIKYPSIQEDSSSPGVTTSVDIANVFLLKTDPYQPWLNAAGITKTYANLDAVLADQTALNTLMCKQSAVDYMISCSGTLMLAVCNNAAAMSELVNSQIAYGAAFAHPWWYKFMTMCPTSLAVMDSVAVTVPTMTNDTTPTGMVMYNVQDSGARAYKAFDKSTSSGASAPIGTATNWWVGYKSNHPWSVYKCTVSNAGSMELHGNGPQNCILQYSVDGVIWIDAVTFVNPKINNVTTTISVNGRLPAVNYHRLMMLDNYGFSTLQVDEIQFYGKVVPNA